MQGQVAAALVLAFAAGACGKEPASGLVPGSGSASVSASGSALAVAPAPSESAPCISAVAEHQRSVMAHLDAARAKMSARDGAGCLVELDAYDHEAWDASPSTSPASAMSMTRAMCMMLAGDCTRGKALYRSAMLSNAGATMGPDALEKSVDAVAGLYCQGTALEPRDALLRALMELNQGAYVSTTSAATCQADVDTIERLLPVVKPRGADDTQVGQASAILRIAGPECLARAGDCEAARRVFRARWLADKPYDEPTLKTMFEGTVRRCSD